MNTHKLTKTYYLPVVKGSQFGAVKIVQGFKSAFQSFLKGPNGSWFRVTNYSSVVNHWMNLPINFKKGYEMFGKEYEACLKANKYLAKQYKRMAKALADGDMVKYTAIFKTLRNKSDCFLMAIFISKIKFYANNYSVSKTVHLLREIRMKLVTESTKLKFRRVFLPEYDKEGNLTKHRPLGVPEVGWRVIAATYEFYLVNVLREEWSENQFACMPRTGVVDAWIKILTLADKADNIVGIDLAKFFDSVFIKTVSYSLGMSKVPQEIITFMEKLHLNKPIISQKELERSRIENLNSEAPVMLYPPVEDLMTSVPEHNWNNRDISLPQGLNTSPLLACHVLNITNAVDSDPVQGLEVVQYVDDAVLIGSPTPEKMVRHYKDLLNPYTTGINISERKTEVIRENGKWIKPLKFLGCEYNGETFKAHTRKGGVYEVTNAHLRIAQIIKWLEENRHSVCSYPRKELSSLINQSWNRQPAWMLLDVNRDLSKWEKERIITTRATKNSVEGRVISKYIGSNLPMIGSTNTMSMLCAGELAISLYKSDKYTLTVTPKGVSQIVSNTLAKERSSYIR
jgi:hypothetical protein